MIDWFIYLFITTRLKYRVRNCAKAIKALEICFQINLWSGWRWMGEMYNLRIVVADARSIWESNVEGHNVIKNYRFRWKRNVVYGNTLKIERLNEFTEKNRFLKIFIVNLSFYRDLIAICILYFNQISDWLIYFNMIRLQND